jgi:hypothetical protein
VPILNIDVQFMEWYITNVRGKATVAVQPMPAELPGP